MNTDFLKSKGPSAISRILGISRQTVTNYIRGDSCMTADQALKLARHYCVPISAVVDPDYRKVKQDDLITALDAENRLLRTKLEAIQKMVRTTCGNVESLIGDLNAEETI